MYYHKKALIWEKGERYIDLVIYMLQKQKANIYIFFIILVFILSSTTEIIISDFFFHLPRDLVLSGKELKKKKIEMRWYHMKSK